MTYKSSDDYHNEGLDFYNKGEFQKALKVFREGLSRFPADPDLSLGCGMTHIRLGDYVQACEILEGLRANAPDPGDVLQGLAEAYLWLGRKEKALEYMEQAVANPAIDASSVNTLALILYEHDQFEEAACYHRKACEIDPQFAPAHMGYAACSHRLGRRQEAAAALEKAIGANPQYWEAYSYLGNLLYDMGQKKEAKAIFEKIPMKELWDPTTITRLLLLSRKEEERDKRRALQERLEEVKRARRNPTLDDFLNELALMLDREPKKKHPQPESRFWTGSSTLVPIMGLRLNSLLNRIFLSPCAFGGDEQPQFARFDKGLCEQYLTDLAKFLEEERKLLKPSRPNKRAIELSGLAHLFLYGAAIIEEMRRRYPAQIVNKAVVSRLKKALHSLDSRIPNPSKARDGWQKVMTVLPDSGQGDKQ